MDYTRSPDTTGFRRDQRVFNCTGITNEAGQPDFPWYWTGTTLMDQPVESRWRVCLLWPRDGLRDGAWVDAHGAGAERSDPKGGSLTNYTYAPQRLLQRRRPAGRRRPHLQLRPPRARHSGDELLAVRLRRRHARSADDRAGGNCLGRGQRRRQVAHRRRRPDRIRGKLLRQLRL